MKIVIVTKEQLPIVRELAFAIWPSAYAEILTKEQLNYMLENFYSISALENQLENGHVFLLAEENNVYLGFASYELNCKSSTKTKLHKIYVLPSTQGSGLGKLLLKEVENKAIAANNTHLFLNVNKYNNAQIFYKKQGFEITLEEVILIGNGYVMDDFVMEKKL